ncbi:MAG: LacI family DNA-binding transcriptional regulator, partial [Acetobacteraceae bacterium]
MRSAVSGGRATSYDVARLAGVAQSTVSRCFQGDGTISPPTRRKVMEAAESLGYVPNALARSLITRRSSMVGVVIARYTLRGNPDVIYAIGESLAAAGKQLLLITVESDLPASAALRGAFEYPFDGLISCVLLGDDDFADLLNRRLPIVFYNRCPDRGGVDSVTADHAAAAACV